jgi:hypothetical protein
VDDVCAAAADADATSRAKAVPRVSALCEMDMVGFLSRGGEGSERPLSFVMPFY